MSNHQFRSLYTDFDSSIGSKQLQDISDLGKNNAHCHRNDILQQLTVSSEWGHAFRIFLIPCQTLCMAWHSHEMHPACTLGDMLVSMTQTGLLAAHPLDC